MATYTPNLNLGKPEATDPFGNFRQLFNDNMDILDNGGGGSSTLAGLSDVDINAPSDGESLVYDSNSQKWVNGNVSGGGGGILLNQTLTFIGTTATITDSRVTADSRVFVYYHDSSLDEALECGLDADTSANTITFEANTAPHGTIVCDIVIDGGVGNGFIGIADCYSTEEKEVGCWTDGKPLYQKTLPFNNVPQNTSNYLIPTSVSDIDTMVSQEAYGISSSNNVYPLPLALRASTADYNAYSINFQGYIKSSNSFRIDTGSQTSVPNGFITFRYTKTTDTAGSGTWTPSGEPSHHYSTNEQVVGTWVDGSTLYERTVFNNGGAITANAGAWTSICSEAWVANVKSIINGNLTRQGTLGNVLVTPVEFTCNGGSIKINPLRNMTYQADGYFTIQYTKS